MSAEHFAEESEPLVHIVLDDAFFEGVRQRVKERRVRRYQLFRRIRNATGALVVATSATLLVPELLDHPLPKAIEIPTVLIDVTSLGMAAGMTIRTFNEKQFQPESE